MNYLRLRVIRTGITLLLVLAGCGALIACLAATARASTATSGLKLSVGVKSAITVGPSAPSYVAGNTAIRLPDIVTVGQNVQARSDGWHFSSNWTGGYDVTIRSTTSPALAGHNAVDGQGANDAFDDYTTGGCPCPWNIDKLNKGAFGYSVVATNDAGSAVDGAAKWTSGGTQLWRGFTTTPYRIWQTGGIGDFGMSLLFQSGVGPNASEEAGSYRANLVVSVSPSL